MELLGEKKGTARKESKGNGKKQRNENMNKRQKIRRGITGNRIKRRGVRNKRKAARNG